MRLFNQLFNRKPVRSGQIAKDRLQYLLDHERLSRSSQESDRFAKDVIETISKCVDVDRAGMDVPRVRQRHLVAHAR
jgi:cell division topological specificity factor MinE